MELKHVNFGPTYKQASFILPILAFLVCAITYHFLIVTPCETGAATFACGQQYVLPDSAKYKSMSALGMELYEGRWNNAGISGFYFIASSVFNYFIVSCVIIVVANYFLYRSLVAKGLVNLQSRKYFWLVVLNPQTVYYVQSPTKEILLYFFMCFALYCFVTSPFRPWLSAFKIAFLSFILRIQYGLATLVPALAMVLKRRDKLLLSRLVFLVVCCLVPFLYQLSLFDTYLSAGMEYSEVSGGQGLGALLRDYESRVILFGLISIPIKVLQNIVDPFPNPFIIYEGAANIYMLKDLFAFWLFGYIPLFCFFWFYYCVYGLKKFRALDEAFAFPFLVIMVLFLLVGLNTFVHGRYLYPLLPVFLYVYMRAKCEPVILDRMRYKRLRMVSFCCWVTISVLLFSRVSGQLVALVT